MASYMNFCLIFLKLRSDSDLVQNQVYSRCTA